MIDKINNWWTNLPLTTRNGLGILFVLGWIFGSFFIVAIFSH